MKYRAKFDMPRIPKGIYERNVDGYCIDVYGSIFDPDQFPECFETIEEPKEKKKVLVSPAMIRPSNKGADKYWYPSALWYKSLDEALWDINGELDSNGKEIIWPARDSEGKEIFYEVEE